MSRCKGFCARGVLYSAFSGGRAAHPEDQTEEENEEKIEENWKKT